MKTPQQLWDYLSEKGLLFENAPGYDYERSLLPIVPGVDLLLIRVSPYYGRSATLRVAFEYDFKPPEGWKFLTSGSPASGTVWWSGPFLPLVSWLYGLGIEEAWWQ